MGKRKNKSVFGQLQNKTSDISSVEKYFKLFQSNDTAISDDIYHDLNIEAFFHYSNRCISPAGEMMLYYRLRHLSKDADVDLSEKVISDISQSIECREKVEATLTKLSRNLSHSVSDLLHASGSLSKWHSYIKYLPILYLIIIISLLIAGQIPVLIVVLAMIMLLNSMIHYWNKMYVDIHIRPLIQLSKLKSAAVELCNIDKYHDTSDIKDSINAVAKLENKMYIFGMNKYLESDIALLFNSVLELIKVVFLIEPIATNIIANKDIEFQCHSKKLIEYVGQWDVSYSIASLRKWLDDNELTYAQPVFIASDKHQIKADELYNPLIPDCIANDIDITSTTIITGSNMSGKSTFLRTIGLNIISAYAMSTCFAQHMQLPDIKLYTILSVSDNILESKSYYLSEVERVKAAIDGCVNNIFHGINIVLIDEIFKGTNTAERISIANAVIKYFMNLNNTICIVSTHDIELAHSFRNSLSIFHFDENLKSDTINFDYKLKPGLEYTRNAISLLKHFDYPEDIITSAEENVNRLQDSFRIEL